MCVCVWPPCFSQCYNSGLCSPFLVWFFVPCAQSPSPLSTFIRHCNTMQSPHYPSYGRQGVPQPAESISDLNRSTASIENLRELQKYSEKLAYESTCCRLWAQGIQTQIQDEQKKVHKWIEGMTEDLLRSKRLQHVQPHWVPSMVHPLQPAPPSIVFFFFFLFSFLLYPFLLSSFSLSLHLFRSLLKHFFFVFFLNVSFYMFLSLSLSFQIVLSNLPHFELILFSIFVLYFLCLHLVSVVLKTFLTKS